MAPSPSVTEAVSVAFSAAVPLKVTAPVLLVPVRPVWVPVSCRLSVKVDEAERPALSVPVTARFR